MELKKLQEEIEKKLNELGYELVSLNSTFNKGENTISIVVDRVEPVDMDAIVDVTNHLNSLFDSLDPFDCPYSLDISSLGAEKPLKVESLDKYINKYVNVHMINPINGENIIEGDMVEVNADNIKVNVRTKTRIKVFDIQKNNISKIRLAIKF